MFPFERPKDYGEMLNKIGLFTFFVALGLTWFVADRVPSIAAALNARATTFDVASLHVPILYFFCAAIVALIARFTRLHNQISDLFRIRERFDINKILIPLAGAVRLNVGVKFTKNLRANRHLLMERTFYAYASFEDPKISKALVLGAIELWTWYWIALEASALSAIAASVLFVSRRSGAAEAAIGVSLGLALIFSSCFLACGKRAEYQINEIVSAPERSDAIRVELLKFAPRS
jgi:hypothetical protein